MLPWQSRCGGTFNDMTTMNRLAVEETVGFRRRVYQLHVTLAEVMAPECGESMRDWRQRAYLAGLVTGPEMSDMLDCVGYECRAFTCVEVMQRHLREFLA